MRRHIIFAIALTSTTIFALAAGPALAASSQPAQHSPSTANSPKPVHATPMSTTGQGGGAVPLKHKKMGPKSCYRNCMKGGMREDFCTLSCE